MLISCYTLPTTVQITLSLNIKMKTHVPIFLMSLNHENPCELKKQHDI